MKTKNLVLIGVSAALLCAISPISITIGVIPITLSLFIIAIIGVLFKPLYSVLIVLVYILIGAIGLPVYSNFTGGLAVLLGLTGGYIIGYIPFILIISYASKYSKPLWKMLLFGVLALFCCYMIGSVWYMFETKSTIWETIMITIVPFIAFDILKLVFAFLISSKLKIRLNIENKE